MPINASTTPSIYETLRQYDDDSDGSDIENRAGMAVDEENLVGEQYADHELEDALAHASDSQSRQSSPFSRRSRLGNNANMASDMHAGAGGAGGTEDTEEADDEVPASLLVEGNAVPSSPLPPPPMHPLRSSGIGEHSLHLRGPSTSSAGQARNRWEATGRAIPEQEEHPRVWGVKQHAALRLADPREKALWRWANVENLDNFLQEVYDYFLGNGIWSIMLSRALNLM